MIEDKKIEEAAAKSANYLKGICDFTVINAFEEGFKEGAKWAVNELLKDLWHLASEEPEKNHFVLFKTAGNSFETEYIGKNDWATIVRCFKVVKWFYVDDLLPKEGGEQMTKWYSAKEAPNYEEWILTEWYDGDDGGIKYETDYLYSFVYWKDYVKRNNITKWCYIKDIKD